VCVCVCVCETHHATMLYTGSHHHPLSCVLEKGKKHVRTFNIFLINLDLSESVYLKFQSEIAEYLKLWFLYLGMWAGHTAYAP